MIFWLAEHQSTTDLALTESLLTSEETLVFAQLFTDERRTAWLLGRSLAKQLVQRYFEVTEQPVPDRRAIGVLPDHAGAPIVHLEGAAAPLALSISHSHGAAFCALTADADIRVGADIERVAAQNATSLLDLLAEAERQAVAAAPKSERAKLATAVWSAQEAYYKALGTGLPLQSVMEVQPMSRLTDAWTAFALQNTEAGVWEGSWRVWGDYVLAVVTG